MNHPSSTLQKKRIESLSGLKVIAAILIFLQHAPIPTDQFHFGSRMCEFFFITSGFLTAYSAWGKNTPTTWEYTLKNALKKIAKFWPLHVLMLGVALLFSLRTFTEFDAAAALLNLLLLHAWFPSPDIYFSYNGVSWFLSSLLFCYFMTPFLSLVTRKVKKPALLFIVTFVIRYYLEYLTIRFPDEIITIPIHTFPITRCLEYFMGYLLVPFHFRCAEYIQKKAPSAWLYSAVEAITLAGMIYLTFLTTLYWEKAVCVLLFCCFVFPFTFDFGIVSKLLATKPFQWFSKIQFEFFIIHSVVLNYLHKLNAYVYPSKLRFLLRNDYTYSLIAFVLVVVLSLLYNKFLSKKLTNLFCRIAHV